MPWLRPANFKTIQTGDLDGDGIDDLIGRDGTGLHVFMYNAAFGAWKPVLTPQGGDELVLGDLSDAKGWDAPQYYETIKLARLEATAAMKLVVRAPSGLTVYQFTRGPDTASGFPTGSWTPVASGGPFSDAAEWDAAPYYQTLRYGTIDVTGAGIVVGWGSNGLATFRWNGSGWTPLTATSSFGDARSHDPGELISAQLAKIDTTSESKLLLMTSRGLTAFRFVSGAGWEPMAYDSDGVFTTSCDLVTCAHTLQTATLDNTGVPVIMAKTSGCKGGMVGVKLNSAQNGWQRIFDSGPFDDCSPNDFGDPRNFRSITVAVSTATATESKSSLGVGPKAFSRIPGTALHGDGR